jgi:hypothetical protein
MYASSKETEKVLGRTQTDYALLYTVSLVSASCERTHAFTCMRLQLKTWLRSTYGGNNLVWLFKAGLHVKKYQ